MMHADYDACPHCGMWAIDGQTIPHVASCRMFRPEEQEFPFL